jgi:hypothetical protein
MATNIATKTATEMAVASMSVSYKQLYTFQGEASQAQTRHSGAVRPKNNQRMI